VKGVEFADKREEQTNFFAKYRIPPNKFYVAGMGTATLRKGIDLFIEACALVCHVDPNVHFVWIGDFIDDHERRMATEMMQNLGLNESSFTLTGFISPHPNNLLPFDILTLTSKEDPYPLVVLEAAFLKIPSIAFKGTGGIGEFIEDDAGFILEERSARSLSETITYLKQNQLLITEKGNTAFKKVTERHSNPDLIIEQFETAIAHVMYESFAP
jgi:glycosyltransferase involved in cell wall biosynthesis